MSDSSTVKSQPPIYETGYLLVPPLRYYHHSHSPILRRPRNKVSKLHQHDWDSQEGDLRHPRLPLLALCK